MATPTTTAGQVAKAATIVPQTPKPAVPTVAPAAAPAQPKSATPLTAGSYDTKANLNGFVFEEATNLPGVIITFYGGKGVGKTTTALGLSGKKYVISLDGKTQRIKQTRYRDDPNVVVLDGREHYNDEDLLKMPAAGKKSCQYIEFLIDSIAAKGDAQWIGFDFLPKLAEFAEQGMRHDHKLGASQGFAELSWWKERNAQMRRFHRKALDALNPQLKDKRCGVFYITYVKQKPGDARPDDTLTTMKKPNYTDVVEQETDIVLYCDQVPHPDHGKAPGVPPVRTTVEFESNKMDEDDPKALTPGTLPTLKTGSVVDLSGGKRLCDVIKDL